MVLDHEEVLAKIAGNIVSNQNPGPALRSWRERLGIRQTLLAKEMKVSPSVLSDYESGRRPSPGVGFIKRYIEGLIELDMSHGKVLEKLSEPKDKSAILAMGEFKRPLKARKLVELIYGKVLKGEELLGWNIYGYTVLDSIRAIYSLSGFDFYRIFGATTERVLIFTKVGLGRSPLIAIRVSQLKPRMVVIHGPSAVDPLAIQLAEKEKIILVLSEAKNESIFAETLRGL